MRSFAVALAALTCACFADDQSDRPPDQVVVQVAGEALSKRDLRLPSVQPRAATTIEVERMETEIRKQNEEIALRAEKADFVELRARIAQSLDQAEKIHLIGEYLTAAHHLGPEQGTQALAELETVLNLPRVER